MRTSHTQELPDLTGVFHQEFRIVWWTLLPALVILTLSVAQLGVKISMLASIAVALVLCVWIQGMPLMELPHILIFGFHSENAEIASMLDGGGIVSMLRVGAIVCLSSSYSGILRRQDPRRDPDNSRVSGTENISVSCDPAHISSSQRDRLQPDTCDHADTAALRQNRTRQRTVCE